MHQGLKPPDLSLRQKVGQSEVLNLVANRRGHGRFDGPRDHLSDWCRSLPLLKRHGSEIVRRANGKSIGREIIWSEYMAPELVFVVAAYPDVTPSVVFHSCRGRNDQNVSWEYVPERRKVDAADAIQKFRHRDGNCDSDSTSRSLRPCPCPGASWGSRRRPNSISRPSASTPKPFRQRVNDSGTSQPTPRSLHSLAGSPIDEEIGEPAANDNRHATLVWPPA